MPILNVYVDEDTLAILERVARENYRSVEDLAESAIAEAALDSAKREANPQRSFI